MGSTGREIGSFSQKNHAEEKYAENLTATAAPDALSAVPLMPLVLKIGNTEISGFLKKQKFDSANRILKVIDDATEHIQRLGIKDEKSMQRAERLYARLKKLYGFLPQTKGKSIAHHQLMMLYKFLVDKRKKSLSRDFNRKTEMIINLIDKGSSMIEKNNLAKAAACYSDAETLFSELPESSFIELKKANLQSQMKLLYDRILFNREIENESRANRNIHSAEVLLERCEKLALADKAAARRLYHQITEVLSSAEAPASMLLKLSEIRQRLDRLKPIIEAETFQASLENFTEYSGKKAQMDFVNASVNSPAKQSGLSAELEQAKPADELRLSDELLFLVASGHNLKSQQGFEEFARIVHDLELCTLGIAGSLSIAEARDKFSKAKKILTGLDGEKNAANKCLAKIRERLEIMAYFERISLVKNSGEAQTLLSELQRKTFDYNLKFPNDNKFSDRVYERCALVYDALEKQ